MDKLLAGIRAPSTLGSFLRCLKRGKWAGSKPHTDPRYQRRGLSWHTLGGHFSDSRPFWTAVGTDVPGGYHRHELCPHIS
ncbi:hypothetical protein [Herbidospora cretacea]|uniref:hypothetical protein n=1 Tax=Herbidospora cretacea TaxID=28444 RepID=UPI0012DBF043|nr:hypothetical protein [Herbidospora cretacea]